MDEITLKDYRCFHEKQTARLAPLTLLVGENSTGKTSFLAMIRALWDAAYRVGVPNFKEDPYDLGSFDEIAHHRGSRGGRADTFEAGFRDRVPRQFRIKHMLTKGKPYRFEVVFGKRGTTPIPVRRLQSMNNIWIDEFFEAGKLEGLTFGNHRGSWKYDILPESIQDYHIDVHWMFPLRYNLLYSGFPEDDQATHPDVTPLSGSPALIPEDVSSILMFDPINNQWGGRRPFASAPVRSKPRRTYDPSLANPDPEGDYVPMYLANLFTEDKSTWGDLKTRLESFGKDAGLFDEITVRQLGKTGSEPFQMQVRKFEGRRKGPLRNLIDVGYGVSQVLPVVTELLRPDPPAMSLLQQPEVHLHPSAQAALGSLFCEVASSGQQLVVETHSDHLLDRIRMDVRDGATGLNPEDVSILFFERRGLDVVINSLTIDEDGNIHGQPDSYRRFFMEETRRSLGL